MADADDAEIAVFSAQYQDGPLQEIAARCQELRALLREAAPENDNRRLVEREFRIMRRTEPLRTRIALYAQSISGVNEMQDAYESMRAELRAAAPNALLERQTRQLGETLHAHRGYQPGWLNERNRYWRVDDAHQDVARIRDFEYCKRLIGVLYDTAATAEGDFDAQQAMEEVAYRFEGFKRERMKKKYSGTTATMHRRFGGAGRVYEEAFDRGYYGIAGRGK